MKRAAVLGLALLTLSGCFVGSIYNVATGPQVYGGVRQDVWWFNNVCKGQIAAFDIPSSFILDTGLLPLTALFELIRALSGWPAPGIR